MPDAQRQGPATFSIEGSDQPVTPAASPQLGAPFLQQQGIAPGLTQQAPGVSDVNSRTFRAISDLASGVLAPKIKEAAQQQFMSGVQRAMTGEGLSEIIKDQPWYTDIFAPSSALAGARTYTAQAAVAQWAGKMQEQMPKLAKVGPEQLQAAATGALQGFLTGDASADSMITAHVVEHMAPLFKQQAKEHYIYVQKVASEAQINAWEAAGKVYQGLAATEASGSGTVSPEDKNAAKARLLGSIVPFADQSDEAYERNIKSFLEGSASNGNFQVVKLFKETGLYDKINPDKRAELDRSLRTFARQALDNQMPKFALDVAMLVNDPTLDPREIPAKVQALNDKAAAITGVTEAQLIPPQSVDNIIGRVLVEQRNAAQSAAQRAEALRLKQQEKVDDFAMAGSLIGQGAGTIDRAIKMGLVKESDAERAGLALFKQAQTPTDAAKVLNSRTLGAFETVKSMFGDVLRSEEYNAPGVGRMAQVYAGLAEDVKPHYFDEKDRAMMDRFNSQVQMGMPEQAAWITARNGQAIASHLIPADPKDEVSKAIRSEVESQNEYKFMGVTTFVNKVDDAGLRTIEAVVSKTYKADRSNNPVDVAVKRSYAEARANGVDIEGKHVIINTEGGKTPPLSRVVGESEVGTANAFESLMASKAKALDASLDNYEAFRVDNSGKAYVYVRATDKNGKTTNWTISSDELRAAVAEHVKANLPTRRTPTGQLTPEGDGVPESMPRGAPALQD